MSLELLIEAGIGECRAALVADGRAVALDLLRPSEASDVGALYRARVAKGSAAATGLFLDLGGGHSAHLSLRRAKAGGGGVPPEGALVTVEIVRAAAGDKLAEATTRLRPAGRYVVVDARAPGGRLLRRASAGIAPALIDEETTALARALADGERAAHGPGLIVPAPSPLARLLRDCPPVAALRVDDPGLLAEIRALCAAWPDVRERLTLDQASPALFSRHGLEEDWAAVIGGRHPLPSGGWIDIAETAALVAIDVNSGQAAGPAARAALAANLEAADEIARQLRLQDIGGRVVVDFIAEAQGGPSPAVLTRLQQRLAEDPKGARLGGRTALGLVELVRPQTGPSLACRLRAAQERRPSLASQGHEALRQAWRLGLQSGPGAVRLTVPPPLAAWLAARPHFLALLEDRCRRRLILDKGAAESAVQIALVKDDGR